MQQAAISNQFFHHCPAAVHHSSAITAIISIYSYNAPTAIPVVWINQSLASAEMPPMKVCASGAMPLKLAPEKSNPGCCSSITNKNSACSMCSCVSQAVMICCHATARSDDAHDEEGRQQ